MQNHGPFTIGATAEGRRQDGGHARGRRTHGAPSRVRAGPLIPIPPEAIDRLYDRYQNAYGQTPATEAADNVRLASGTLEHT